MINQNHAETVDQVRLSALCERLLPRHGNQFECGSRTPQGMVRIDPETQHTSKTFRIGRITADGRFELEYSSDVPIAPKPNPYPQLRSQADWDDFLNDLRLRWNGNWANPQSM